MYMLCFVHTHTHSAILWYLLPCWNNIMLYTYKWWLYTYIYIHVIIEEIKIKFICDLWNYIHKYIIYNMKWKYFTYTNIIMYNIYILYFAAAHWNMTSVRGIGLTAAAALRCTLCTRAACVRFRRFHRAKTLAQVIYIITNYP